MELAAGKPPTLHTIIIFLLCLTVIFLAAFSFYSPFNSTIYPPQNIISTPCAANLTAENIRTGIAGGHLGPPAPAATPEEKRRDDFGYLKNGSTGDLLSPPVTSPATETTPEEKRRDDDDGYLKNGSTGDRLIPPVTAPAVLPEEKGRDDGYLRKCDIFTGEWVPNPEAPYYTNETCYSIQLHQNCMKYGRPDSGYLNWRWKPDGCELPVFDPRKFLEVVRNKSLAFVGDSIARNHFQSLICLLTRVAYPVDISNSTDDNRKHMLYKDYNFTVRMFWSPYLVKTGATFSERNQNPFDLYLDEFDESWTSEISTFNYVIINAGHWFFRPTKFYLDGHLVGCLYCPETNVTHLTKDFSYRWALRTAFRGINSLENFKGVTFLRSFAPQHFENGAFDQGGACVRTEPFNKKDTILGKFKLGLFDIQKEEFAVAEKEGQRKGQKFRFFDVTKAMLLRPDGHPNNYGHWPNPNITMYNDCVHWCLPGPIDTWSDFFLELVKREIEDEEQR